MTEIFSQPWAYKRCPVCKGNFELSTQRCPVDGILLLAPDPRIGTTIDGRFEILEVLGEGAAGIVFKARQSGFDRLVALKILKAAGADTTAIVRFKREAQVLSQVRHPNIAAVYAFGVTAGGDPYIVCELIDGKRLSDYPLHGDLKLGRELGLQLCDALACLHKNGIVHRDVKPTNLMIETAPDGKVLLKLLDLGSARLLPEFHDGQQGLTRAGEVFGTISYIAPEQAAGTAVDARADIYSAGRVLSDLLNTDGSLPPQVAAVVDKCTATAPEGRYKSVQQLRAALSEASLAMSERRAASLRRPTLQIVALMLALVVLPVMAGLCLLLAADDKQAASLVSTLLDSAYSLSPPLADSAAQKLLMVLKDKPQAAAAVLRRQLQNLPAPIMHGTDDASFLPWNRIALQLIDLDVRNGKRDELRSLVLPMHRYLVARVALFEGTGDFARAKQDGTQDCRIMRLYFAPGDQALTDGIDSLAKIYASYGDLSVASNLWQEALNDMDHEHQADQPIRRFSLLIGAVRACTRRDDNQRANQFMRQAEAVFNHKLSDNEVARLSMHRARALLIANTPGSDAQPALQEVLTEARRGIMELPSHTAAQDDSYDCLVDCGLKLESLLIQQKKMQAAEKLIAETEQTLTERPWMQPQYLELLRNMQIQQATLTGDKVAAAQLAQECIQSKQPARRQMGLVILGDQAMHEQQFQKAEELYRQAEACRANKDDMPMVMALHLNLATVLLINGKDSEAWTELEILRPHVDKFEPSLQEQYHLRRAQVAKHLAVRTPAA